MSGCGVGFLDLLMAKGVPGSTFVGYDFHGPSIEQANAHAKAHGLADRVKFVKATAKEIADRDFDLVTMFDWPARHGRPTGLRQADAQAPEQDGTWMLVEPIAGDKPAENVGNPVTGSTTTPRP